MFVLLDLVVIDAAAVSGDLAPIYHVVQDDK
jgi:hypothetical protein